MQPGRRHLWSRLPADGAESVADFERRLWMYSCARWVGLRVWNATIFSIRARETLLSFPRLEAILQERTPGILSSRVTFPPRQNGGVEVTFFAPGCASSAVPNTASASRTRSTAKISPSLRIARRSPLVVDERDFLTGLQRLRDILLHSECDRNRPRNPRREVHPSRLFT